MGKVASTWTMLAWCATFATAQTPLRFQGEAFRGRAYSRDIGRGLRLVLDPTDPSLSGWIIKIVPKAPPRDVLCADHLWSATPPFRFDNQRYLDTSYGKSAVESIRRWAVRDFAFFVDCSSALSERGRIELALWPAGHDARAVDRALAELGKSPRATGKLEVLESKIEASADRIDWIRFSVEIRWPSAATSQ